MYWNGCKISVLNASCWILFLLTAGVLLSYRAEILVYGKEVVQTSGFAPIVISISACIAFLGVIISSYVSRRTSKDTETISYLMSTLQNEALIDAIRSLCEMAEDENGQKVCSIASKPHDDETRLAMKLVLSHYETLAVGLNNCIYNEKMMLDAAVTKVVYVFDTLQPYIRKIREQGHKTAYKEFEELAGRWRGEQKRRFKKVA